MNQPPTTSDAALLGAISLTFGSRLEGLSREQKRALTLRLALKLSSLESLIEVPPYLANSVKQLSEEGVLDLLEATVAQLRRGK